jgi:methionyl-tRNA synthetase
MISYEDFKKMEIVTAVILEAEDHPNADKLYSIKIDIGGETRNIVAGIKGAYDKEELIGRQIVVLKNLEPAVIRGVESRGMLLAASSEKGPVLLGPERETEPGSPVK